MKKSLVLVSILVLAASACRRETPSTPPPPAGGAPQAGAPQQGGAETATPKAGEKDFNAALTQKLNEYSADNLDGSKFTLASTKGKAVVLNVWATWCGPCRYEIPELQKLQAENSAKGLEVIGVSVDDTGARQQVADFVRDQKMTYRVVHDGEGTIATIMQTSVIPATAVLDRKGTVVWYGFGVLDTKNAEFQSALQKALAS